MSRYQKGKTNLDFTEARDSEWQWHQLAHMHVCTSLQTDNHASTPPLSFLLAACPSYCPTNSVKALKVSTKIRVFYSGTLSETLCLKHLETASRLRCQRSSLLTAPTTAKARGWTHEVCYASVDCNVETLLLVVRVVVQLVTTDEKISMTVRRSVHLQ